jgi:phage/conjugal plasmid C-4 type zinc finger TraR family protein
MGDIIDRAQQYDEQYREIAIASHFSSRIAQRHQPRAADCIDCGEEIPADRREAVPDATRCIGCQEKHERIYGRNGWLT